MQNSKCIMQNAECKIQNAECKMQNAESSLTDYHTANANESKIIITKSLISVVK